MKKIYKKPAIEVMQVELSDCIASSPSVKQGQTVHQILEGSGEGRIWGDATYLGSDGKPI